MSVSDSTSHLSMDLSAKEEDDLPHLDLLDKLSAKEKFLRKRILQLKDFIEINSGRARLVFLCKQVDKCFSEIALIFNKLPLERKVHAFYEYDNTWLEILRFDLDTCISDVEEYIESITDETRLRNSTPSPDQNTEKVFASTESVAVSNNESASHNTHVTSDVRTHEYSAPKDFFATPKVNNQLLSVDLWIANYPVLSLVAILMLPMFLVTQVILSIKLLPIRIFLNYKFHHLMVLQLTRLILWFSLRI